LGVKYFRIFLVIFLFLIFTPGITFAEIKPNTLEMGISAGGLFLDPEVLDDNSFQFNLALGTSITKHAGAEITLLNSFDSLFDTPKASFYSFNANYKFFPDSDINPYILLGLGSGTFRENGLNETKFAASGGIGFYFSFWKNIAFRLDFRDYMTFNEIAHNYTASLGVMYVFDYTEPLPPVVSAPSEEPTPYRPEIDTGAEPVSRPIEAEAETSYEPSQPAAAEETPPTSVSRPTRERPATRVTPAAPPTAPAEEQIEPIEEEIEPMEEEALPTQVTRPTRERPVTRVTPVPSPRAERPSERTFEKPSEIVRRAEETPLYKLHVLYKGAMLGIDFPFKDSEINSKSFDLLLELIAYMRPLRVKSILIVPLSSEYESINEILDIGQLRASKIIDIFIRNSDISKESFTIIAPDRSRLEKFYHESEGRTNRVYIIVSFE